VYIEFLESYSEFPFRRLRAEIHDLCEKSGIRYVDKTHASRLRVWFESPEELAYFRLAWKGQPYVLVEDKKH